MDNPGWHAQRRARKEEEYYNTTTHHGPDGRWQPVEQVAPMDEPFIGGFAHPHPPRSPLPPPIPPKDPVYAQPGYHIVQPSNGTLVEAPSPTSTAFNHMNAVERSKTLRVARMDPHLQFMCGPLLRYDTVDEGGIWRGAVLIVTADAASVYAPHPTLQYEWDPDVHPNESPRVGSMNGLPHDRVRSFDLGPHPADPHSLASTPPKSLLPNGKSPMGPNARSESVPGQEIWVYSGYGGTFTFWRFIIEIPLGELEMAVHYTVNNGQHLEFFVPGKNQNFRWAAHSCNGFSAGINPDDFRGPGFKSGYDPLWIDLLAHHAEQPFHAMVGGGDQIYCDSLMREPEMQEWVKMKPEEKKSHPLTEDLAATLDRFYFNHYCQHFRSGAFARANSSIPMMNMADDHDLIDGFGSYPDDLQLAPVFRAIGARGYFFFLLFQCFINVDLDGTDDTPGRHLNRSLIIGGPGPYVRLPSHSFLAHLGPQTWILLLDCRAERRKEQVCSPLEYQKVFQRLQQLPSTVDHLVVQVGIPIAYPRMVFLESALESKLNPFVALGRNGALGLSGFVNKFNAQAELLDDLNDHWTATSHKKERNWFIEQLQMFAKRKQIRVTFLSGDVHCAAVGVLKTLKAKRRQELPPSIDHRYMINVVTSAIVNTPPPVGVISLVSSLASKVHKTLHHIDTDENMMPLFPRDPNGTQRKQKFIMGRRNWCKVEWDINTRDLVFDIRVEKEKGAGQTVGYAARTPPPGWQPSE